MAENRDPDTSSLPAGPIGPAQRIPEVDILRALAILGMALFNYGTRDFGDYRVIAPSDRFVAEAIRLFDLDHTVSLIFAFLIGYGFSSHSSSGRTAVRRLTVLLGIGLVHGLMWSGDVLRLYAVIGLLLLPLRSLPARALAVAALVIAGLPVLVLAMIPPDVLRPIASEGQILWWTNIASLWLLGNLAGRIGILTPSPENRGRWRRALLLALPVAAIGEAWHPVLAWLRPRALQTEWIGWVYPLMHRWSVSRMAAASAPPALAVAYIAAILLLLNRTMALRLTPLAAAGRMALTNYLLQSAIALALFSKAGLGWSGRLGYAAGSALAILVFACEVAFSVLWLERFRFGPLEWISRSLTYGVPVRNRTLVSRDRADSR